jgi:tripartite-type tricarboxylate transporter receptor subunit TctC
VPLAQGGKVKMLAIADAKRLADSPTVPTMAEQGISGLEVRVWNGILAPKGTPASIVSRYNETINEILRSAAIAETLRKRNIQIVGGSGAMFGELIKHDLVFWAKTIREANITLE